MSDAEEFYRYSPLAGSTGGGIADVHAYRERLLGAAYKAAALMES
jgi:hypothetical protein